MSSSSSSLLTDVATGGGKIHKSGKLTKSERKAEALRLEAERQLQLENDAKLGAKLICSIDSDDKGCYNDVDENSNEFLDLSGRDEGNKAGMSGTENMFKELSVDRFLKQVDLSYNITLEEAHVPQGIHRFLDNLEMLTRKNKTLTALDLSSNHIGAFAPNSFNNHLPKHKAVNKIPEKAVNKMNTCWLDQRQNVRNIPLRAENMGQDYWTDLSKILLKSNIKRLDISDNSITGTSGTRLSGLRYFFRTYVHEQCQAIKVRMSNIHAGSIGAVCEGLGHGSDVEHIDLSDNRIGVAASNIHTHTGVETLFHALSCTEHVRVIKLARNSLRDEEIEYVARGINGMATLEVLDLQGNYCHDIGMGYLKTSLHSLGSFTPGELYGLKFLNLSQNPIGDIGVKHLSETIDRNDCMIALKIAECGISDAGMSLFLKTMERNTSILWLDVTKNLSKLIVTAETNAEAEANRCLQHLQKDHMSIDTTKLSRPVYMALKNKLHTLPERTGHLLHFNDSFNVPLSTMKEALHCAFIPSRRTIFTETIRQDPKFSTRLQQSVALGHKMLCARTIARHVMKWYIKVREYNKIRRAMQLQRELQAKEDAFNQGIYT